MMENPHTYKQSAEGSYIAQAIGTGTIATVITNVFQNNTEERNLQRSRQKIIAWTKQIWLRDVLEHSLDGRTIIQTDLEVCSDRVDRSLGSALLTSKQSEPFLLSGKRLIDIFDESHQALLVLGEPGSGKTTLLLDMARTMIGCAESDPMYPIPVVLNLSSWSNNRQRRFEDWLVEAVNSSYSIPDKVARFWIQNDEVVLLLDGLDEVRQKDQKTCVKAINEFRQAHGLMPILISSRVTEYLALSTQLKLQVAVVLQPLTIHQINTYLFKCGDKYSSVRWLLQQSAELRELSKLPLIFKMVVQVYGEMSLEKIEKFCSAEGHSANFFEIYIEQMYSRMNHSVPYSLEEIKRWLTRWCVQMNEEGKNEIYELDVLWVFNENRRAPFSSWFRLIPSITLYAFVNIFFLILYLVAMGIPFLGGAFWIWSLLKMTYLIKIIVFFVCFIGIFLVAGIISVPFLFLSVLVNDWMSNVFFYLSGYAPWQYKKFFEHLVEIHIFRRSGLGNGFVHPGYKYTFIHKLLMDHFTSLYRQDVSR